MSNTSNSTSQFVQTDLLNIGYERQGTGTPLVLLHGWPDDVRTGDKVIGALVDGGYSTIAPYLRGYGATTFLDAATRRSGQVVAFAHDVIDLLDALEIEKVVFVGHDWGAGRLCPRRIVAPAHRANGDAGVGL